MLYIPWQVFAILEILNGKKHPLRILKDALLIILRHYQSVFYSLLALVVRNRKNGFMKIIKNMMQLFPSAQVQQSTFWRVM